MSCFHYSVPSYQLRAARLLILKAPLSLWLKNYLLFWSRDCTADDVALPTHTHTREDYNLTITWALEARFKVWPLVWYKATWAEHLVDTFGAGDITSGLRKSHFCHRSWPPFDVGSVLKREVGGFKDRSVLNAECEPRERTQNEALTNGVLTQGRLLVTSQSARGASPKPNEAREGTQDCLFPIFLFSGLAFTHLYFRKYINGFTVNRNIHVIIKWY